MAKRSPDSSEAVRLISYASLVKCAHIMGSTLAIAISSGSVISVAMFVQPSRVISVFYAVQLFGNTS